MEKGKCISNFFYSSNYYKFVEGSLTCLMARNVKDKYKINLNTIKCLYGSACHQTHDKYYTIHYLTIFSYTCSCCVTITLELCNYSIFFDDDRKRLAKLRQTFVAEP